MGLNELILQLSQSGNDVLTQNLTSRITNVRDYLVNLPEVRLFVLNSQNFGHLASTVNILRNFIRMGVPGPFTFILAGQNIVDAQMLMGKLAVLVPQYTAGAEGFVLETRVVRIALMYPTSGELPRAPFAINGGFDDLEGKTVPYDQLNVVNYVQLQPYAWHRGTNMVRIDELGLPTIVNLDELSPGTNLMRRAFYLDPVLTPDDWEAMLVGAYRQEAAVCRFLLEELDASRIFLTIGYGFGTKGGGWSNLYNMVAGARQSQVSNVVAQRATVIVAVGVSQEDWSAFTDILFFGEGPESGTPNYTTFYNTVISEHVTYEGSGDNSATLEKVGIAVGKIVGNPQQVLVVFLQRVPGPLFDNLYRRASLPPLFEGQNTTELMLNFGKPYLKISSNIWDTTFGYPTTPLNSLVSGTEALEAQDRAYNGVVASRPSVWYTNQPTYPPTQLPPVTAAYLTPGGNALAIYFTGLGRFFHDELNDKLLRGLDLFVNMIGPGGVGGIELMKASASALAQVNIVEALYLRLVEYTHDGVLNLLQAITTGDIYDFFSQVVDDTVFRITDALPELNESKTLCTLTGKTRAFGQEIGLTGVAFEFTDDNDSGKLKTVFKADFTATWALPGADWLSISKPAFKLAMSPVADVPFMAAMTARVTAGISADMTLTIPIAPGIFELQVVFVAPRPSITNIFQLVGGINLQQYLPSQLQLFTDIEVASFTTRYNYAQQSVEMMGASLGTPPNKTWNLVPAVVVNKIVMNVSVVAPGDRVRRKTSFDITGDFGIADATAYITAYAPQLRVIGGLRDDSKPLDVKSIVKTYLGDEFVAVLPTAIAEARISGLSFMVDQAAGRYAFAMTVDTIWEIPPGSPLFTVTQLGFDIKATSRAIDTPSGKEGRTVVLVGNEQAPPGPSNTEITGSFSGNITVDTSETDKAQITVSAKYLGSAKGWTFSGKQTGGEVNLSYLVRKYLGFDVPPEYNYALDGLSVTIATGDGAWAFTAKTKDYWTVPFIPLPPIYATFAAGYNPPKAPVLAALRGTSAGTALAATNGCNGTGNFARVEVKTRWNNIELMVWYDYCDTTQSFGITWEFLEALVKQQGPQKEWIGVIRFTKGTTLGSIVERMVRWLTGSAFALEAPWSVLNSIPLNNLSLEYNFTRNTVSFNIDIGPIELGIARIDSISVVYDNDTSKPEAPKGVFVTLKGSFLWNTGPNANGDKNSLGPWDTSKPGTAPAPPGNGNKYLDLRLLAMGQHVTATCLPTAVNVQAAIACLASLPDTKAGETPKVLFDPRSAWLIGTEFGILKFGDEPKPPSTTAGDVEILAPPPATTGYLFTLQIVFNDPTLYALRIALAGPAAKIFKGLDFQVMYRQISESVGVYQAEITLPDVMRYLSIGVYSLTLPVFGISVYTNGDFMVDVGFPWKEDFSRSFTIEGIVYPGIPLLGSAGFYFGKLSSATTNKVPAVTNGTFNPVIVFGFGLQFGVGKSIHYGILSAGFSITVFGIVEGVIAKWNPYQITDGATSDNSQLQGAYYFWLRGTVGVIGKVFGSVDFAIIKADVNIEVKLMLQLTYESFVSIAITVIASVSVSVSIKIDLGLFSIKISFSFAMRLKETFTIENKGKAPWKLASASSASLLAGPSDSRLRALRAGPSVVAGANWYQLENSTTKQKLEGYFAPALAVAHDEWDTTGNAAMQTPCYVALVALKSVPPPSWESLERHTALATGADTSFDLLAKMVFRWAVAAKQPSPVSWETVDALIVTAETLEMLINVDLRSSDENPTPIPPEAASEFMRRQFELTASLPPASGTSGDTTFFPIAPELLLDVPAWGTNPRLSYRFSGYNDLDKQTLARLRAYFDELAVKVQQERGTAKASRMAEDDKPLSMASWIFSDYFLLIARQMVQAARDALRQFKYAPPSGATPNGVVDWINRTGQLEGADAYSLFDLFAANPAHPLNAGKTLRIGVAAPATPPLTSFDRFAADSPENAGAFTATDLALANAASRTILRAGATVAYGTGQTYTIRANDSLLDVAAAFDAPLADLLINSDVLVVEALGDGARVLIPYVVYRALASDSFHTIANDTPVYAKAFTSETLAMQNAGRPILQPDVTVVYTPKNREYTTVPNDTLATVATQLDVTLDQLFAGSDVLTNPALIAPVSVIVIPVFSLTTSAGDALQTFQERFAIGLDVLAFASGNGDQPDLFLVDAGYPHLDVPHLAQFQVGELLAEAQRSLAIAQLSGMTSCYYLHGMRLPTEGINPLAEGMWVKKSGVGFDLPDYAGVYALTGQQIPVPVIPNVKDTPPFVLTLDRSGGPGWFLFANGDEKLTVTIAWDSTDAERIRRVAGFVRGGPAAIPLSTLGSGRMYESELARYPFASSLLWQAAAEVNLPYGSRPAGGVPSLRLWRMPDSMVNLSRGIDRASGNPAAMLPRFAVNIARYDEATGTTVTTPVSNYGWATTIEFSVKRVPDASAGKAAETTYEIVGASGNSILALERLIEQVGSNDGYFHQLILGYAPEQTGDATEGVQTDAPAVVTFGIAQVNLSTITRPPQGEAAKLLSAESPGLGLLNRPSEFVQLLWTASITRAGGFYLYYYDAGQKRGLPERIFNDRNEAALVLALVYARPQQAFDQNRLTNFMNAVAVAEAVDAANAIIFAEVDPPELKLPSASLGSLDQIGYDYFTDVGDLAEANADHALTTGKTIFVAEGLYQPPPGPAVPTADVEKRFSTTRQALAAANPRYGGSFPDAITFPTAINLPLLDLTSGTSPSSGSFAEIQMYYGQKIASLAADARNRAVSPIFAPGQTVNIPGGPRNRTSTAPPGVQTLIAVRDKAGDVPINPNDPGYAEKFVFNNFSLLNYSVAQNLYFKGSNIGLPAGPTSTPDDTAAGKIVLPAASEAVSTWEFQQSIPYPSFALTPSKASAAHLPDPGESPYRGVGYLLQPGFSWQDYYGNTLITTLASPSSGRPPFDQPPLRTGYGDLLIALSQWPSVASNFQVDKVSGSPALRMLLSFDASRYEGLLLARRTGPTSVVASFTQSLDRASAETAINYAIEGSVVTHATLDDARTVTLTVESLGDGEMVLTVNNVKAASSALTFSGQATFVGDVVVSSTLNQSARTALTTYRQLFYQLNDANGIAYALESTLVDEAIPLTEAEIAELTKWLFEGGDGQTSIYEFIADRAAWQTAVAAPAASLTFDFPIDPANLNSRQIFLLAVSFVIRRTGGAVLGDLETMPGITRAATEVPPRFAKLGANENDSTMGLTEFATLFQQALSVPGSYALKIATGVDRARVATARNGSVLWVVRVGLRDDVIEPIAYAIDHDNITTVFAPRPISNELQNHTGVPIRTYQTGKGLTGPVVTLDFAGIDMDAWGREFFSSIDGVLTPEFTAAIQIVGKFRDGDYLAQLLEQKKQLAAIASLWMIPAFADESGADPKNVREAYYQQMLVALVSAYTTRAAVEYRAKVNATVDEAGYPIIPRLFGPVAFSSPRIVSASATDENPTDVLVVYSAPMDEATAADPTNYTITTGGPVSAASLGADGLTVTLSLAAPAAPGVSTLTVAADVKDRRGRDIRPPRTVVIRRPDDVRDASAEVTFSSPKLDLAVSDSAPVAFLVMAPENVRGGGGEIVASLDLDLAYNATDIEHQISRPEGVEGYVASSWLSFVIRDDEWPLERLLGQTSVPMPLRSFPESPAMNAQTPLVNPNAPELSSLTKWAYLFTYSLPVHYPHDRVMCEVAFNLNSGQMAKAAPDLLNAFNELAQFITVFPKVNQDLIQFLGQIDATSDPAGEGVADAAVALESTIEMIRDVTTKAAGGLVVERRAALRLGDPTLTYSFHIQECTVKSEGDPLDGALLVSLTGKPPEGVAMPWVRVDDPAYRAERYYGVDCSNSGCDDVERFCFVYRDADGHYLSAEKGQTIAGRTVELPGLDLFQRQNAQATTSIRRNVELVPGRASAEPFIYTTSNVSFANPLQPTVDSTRPYDVAALGSSGPVVRSLKDQLANLFDNLLRDNQQPMVTAQVEVTYDYVLNANLPAVPLPILMQPPMSVAVRGVVEGAMPLEDMLTSWSEAIRLWFATVLPLGSSGRLHFSLTLMTNLAHPPMPLLWARELDLGLEWIDPPLPTR